MFGLFSNRRKKASRVDQYHYIDVIISVMASQIASVAIVGWNVESGIGQRRHQSSVSLAFVRWILRWPVHSPHKGPVPQKRVPFDDAIIIVNIKQRLFECIAKWEPFVKFNQLSVFLSTRLFVIQGWWHAGMPSCFRLQILILYKSCTHSNSCDYRGH